MHLSLVGDRLDIKMSIKIKFTGGSKGKNKATIKFSNPAETQWFKEKIVSIRDSDPRTTPHPQLVVKNMDGTHVKPLKPSFDIPKKLTPEMIAKMKQPPEIVKNSKPLAVKKI